MFLRRFRQGRRFASWNIIPISAGRGPMIGAAVEQDLAAGQGVQPRHRPEQRRLPAAARPENADQLAGRDVEREVVECVDGAGLRFIDLRRAADLELRRLVDRAQNHPSSSGFAYCMNSTTAPSTIGERHREEAVADVEGLGQHLETLDRGVDVVHAVGDMGLGTQRACHRAVGLEAEPLHVVRVLAGAGDPHARRLDPALTRFHVVGDEADVIEPGASELWHQVRGTDACKLIGKVSNIAGNPSQ